MLSKTRQKAAKALDNDTLVCVALLAILVIFGLIGRLMPKAFMPLHANASNDLPSIYMNVIVCFGISNLFGVLAIFFGIKALNDMRKASGGRVNVMRWTYWLYLATVAFGVFAVIKSILIFWLQVTA